MYEIFTETRKRRCLMRISMIYSLILIGGFQLLFASNGRGQSLEEIIVTIKPADKNLEHLLKDIELQTHLTFAYLPSDVRKYNNIGLKPGKQSVKSALDKALVGTELRYRYVENSIIIFPGMDVDIRKTPELMVGERSNDISMSSSSQASKNEVVQALSITTPLKIFERRLVRNISGRVVDSEGEPLIGVNIQVKDSSKGTATDFDGNFTLEDIDENAVLVISYIGYQTQEIVVGGKSDIEIVMVSDSQLLDEVVVVGYGTQKKVNLTGAVSTVGEKELNKRSVTQSSQLLQGAVSGITATQSSGEPGVDGAALKIRGLGTFSGAGTNPLVLVDGVPASINSVNPNDIESISVLKDAASAAIYGSRAANGVILVQTKEGKEGVLQVNYNSYIGKQQATDLPKYVDSWTYAEMKNEARINMGQNPEFTQEEIDMFRSGVDLDNYPNKNHVKDLFNSGSGLQMKHNLSFSGGAKDIRYLFSTGYLKQDGIIEQNEYERYDMLLSVNSNLNNNLRLNAKLHGSQTDRNTPAGIATDGARTSGLSGVIAAANSYNATVPGRKSDGTFGTFAGHPAAEGHLASGSFDENKGTSFGANISLELDITEFLKLSSRFSYRYGHSKNRLFGAFFVADPNWSFGPSQANVNSSMSSNILNDVILEFDKGFGNHNFNVFGGFSNESNNGETLSGFRDDFPSNNLNFLSAASPTNRENSESGSSVKLISYFGRLNYSFKGRYIFEANLRYDGSSRFDKDNRFGLFPSSSAAWNVSEEEFFEVNWIDHLKIRGSYGVLGNQEIGVYPYQKVLSLGSSYVTGEQEILHPGVQLTRLPFQDITWETTKIGNIGVDISVFEGKLNFVTNFYRKKTDNILYSISVPHLLGMSVGEVNAGEVENKGFELELTHRNKVGELDFSITPNFSVNHNKVLSLAGVERDISKGLFVGEPLNSIYGYKTDGLFIDENDIENYANQNYTAKPGWPRFVDISGPDGKPDGKISSADDRMVIGNQFPKYTFGMGINAEYKGFEFYLQMQGLGGLEKSISGSKQLAFLNNGNIQQWHIDDRWTEDNPDRNSKYPRLEMALHEYPWDAQLDYWLRNASFLRLKTIQLGYNLPSKILESTFVDQCRVFVNGENVLSFNSFYPGWDPEMSASGRNPSYYPVVSLWSFGISVQF